MPRECSYTWKIKDFEYREKRTGHSIQSTVFWIDEECKWKLVLYPRGIDRANSDYLSVFVDLVSSSKYLNVSVMYTFAILDVEDDIIFEDGRKKWRSVKLYDGFGFSDFIRRKTLFRRNYLQRGALKLFCKVTYYSSEMLNNTSLYQRNNDLSSMLMNATFSDLTFLVRDEEFPAHKVILAAKSPAFYRAFHRSEVVMINDIAPEIFEEILRFVYTGAVRNLHANAKDLIVAAKKYKIRDLRDTCVDYFVGRLTVDNAIETVQLAQECNCCALKKKVFEFINKNFVKESPKYLVWQLTNALKNSRISHAYEFNILRKPYLI